MTELATVQTGVAAPLNTIPANSLALLHDVTDKRVDFLLRAHVDAACRVVQDQYIRAARQRARGGAPGMNTNLLRGSGPGRECRFGVTRKIVIKTSRGQGRSHRGDA